MESIKSQINLIFKPFVLISLLPKFSLLFIVPVFSIYYLRKHRKKLQKPEIKIKFGSLYENINTLHRRPLLYMSFFCLRRFLLSVAIVWLPEFPLFQLAIYLASTIMMWSFYVTAKPMERRATNRIEALNEILILGSFYFNMMFTGILTDA